MNSLTYWKNVVGKDFDKIKKFTIIEDLLQYTLQNFKNDNAISWLGHSVTYGQFYEDVAKARHLFLKNGLKRGQNVGLLFKNEYNFVLTYFALNTLGICAVIIPPVLPPQALLGSLKKFNVSGVVYGVDCEASLTEIKPMFNNIPFISYKELENLENIKADADKNVKPEDAAVIIFTGGTTGTPKGAVLCQRALLRGSYNGTMSPAQLFGNKYLAVIPFFHIFGLVRNLLTSFNSGSDIYLVKDMMRFVNEIKDCKPTIMVVVPALANLIYSIVAQHGIEAVGGKLKLIIAGGAHVTPDSIKRLGQFGIRLLPGYGLTESANLTSGNASEVDKVGSIGFPYPEQDVKIVDGEILIKGDNLFTCYYNDPAETQHVYTEDGYLKTGDLGEFDEDGFLYITGRSKNIIVMDNGENISPEFIEDKLDNVPLINSSLIYEVKSPEGRGLIAAKIYPNLPVLQKLGITDIDKAINDAVAKVNEQLPDYMKVVKVTILKEDFKRSGALKIIRKANI